MTAVLVNPLHLLYSVQPEPEHNFEHVEVGGQQQSIPASVLRPKPADIADAHRVCPEGRTCVAAEDGDHLMTHG